MIRTLVTATASMTLILERMTDLGLQTTRDELESLARAGLRDAARSVDAVDRALALTTAYEAQVLAREANRIIRRRLSEAKAASESPVICRSCEAPWDRLHALGYCRMSASEKGSAS